jgi:hypothetical protein
MVENVLRLQQVSSEGITVRNYAIVDVRRELIPMVAFSVGLGWCGHDNG